MHEGGMRNDYRLNISLRIQVQRDGWHCALQQVAILNIKSKSVIFTAIHRSEIKTRDGVSRHFSLGRSFGFTRACRSFVEVLAPPNAELFENGEE